MALNANVSYRNVRLMYKLLYTVDCYDTKKNDMVGIKRGHFKLPRFNLVPGLVSETQLPANAEHKSQVYKPKDTRAYPARLSHHGQPETGNLAVKSKPTGQQALRAVLLLTHAGIQAWQRLIAEEDSFWIGLINALYCTDLSHAPDIARHVFKLQSISCSTTPYTERHRIVSGHLVSQ
jgi:hypothetical protein